MLTRKDHKAFHFASKHPFLAKYALWVGPFAFMVFAGMQLEIAGRLAEPLGLSLGDLISLWFGGIEPEVRYNGLALSAIVRVERAFGMFCMALAFFGLALAVRIGKKREQRLYEALAQCTGTHTDA